jgi:hypothetical protein
MVAALLDMLPRVSEEDGTLLTTAHRELLNFLLYYNQHQVAISAFLALEKVGDSTALPYLGSIANGKGIPGALKPYSADAQARAKNIVAAIHARIDSQKRSDVLLRPASAPGAQQNELVRPANTINHEPQHELLRAVSTDSAVADTTEDEIQ